MSSDPVTRSNTPSAGPSRISAPPIPPSKNLPTNFGASIGIWWNNSGYKEARVAEERLLRRMEIFERIQAEQVVVQAGDDGEGEVSMVGERDGMKASLRNVSIPTPDPAEAPAHPADPAPTTSRSSATSSTSSLSQSGGRGEKKNAGRRKSGTKMGDYINTLEISSRENMGSKEAVVVNHGYAAAMGFFFLNWESIAQSSSSTGRRCFFIDWLGMGLSSRPSADLLASPPSTPIAARVARAEHFFVDSLESWRIAVGVERMLLIGHSLGGYLSAAYSVRYPERLSGLILMSPAGIPRGPKYRADKPEGEKNEGNEDEAVDAAEMEVDQDQAEVKGKTKEPEPQDKGSFLKRTGMKVFTWGWERGLSPFTFLRVAGPWGPLWATHYTRRRFGSQKEEDVRDIHGYIYNMSILKGSGEFCVSYILAVGAYGRIPIVDRIGKVKVPVTFIYGEKDWMDKDGGHAAVKELQKAGNDGAVVHIVPKAGHHVYLDNPTDTNQLVGEAIKAIPIAR